MMPTIAAEQSAHDAEQQSEYGLEQGRDDVDAERDRQQVAGVGAIHRPRLADDAGKWIHRRRLA